MEFDLNFNLTTNLFSTYYVLDTIEKDKDLKKKKNMVPILTVKSHKT